MSFPDERTYEYRPRTWSPTPAAPIPPPTGGFHYQPGRQLPPKKSRLGYVLVAVLAVLVVAGAVTLVSVVAGVGPLSKDRGVRACEAIATIKSGQKIDTSGLGSGRNGAAVLRDAFNHSRYSDLKKSGTEAMDLMGQLAGTTDDEAAGLTIVAGGQMVEKWGALSGACSAHGVDIPSLSEMGK